MKNFADSKIDPSVWSHIFSRADCDQDGFVNKEELTRWFFGGENVSDGIHLLMFIKIHFLNLKRYPPIRNGNPVFRQI